ncbi:hypothetical protein [Streptomyces sp. NPDC057877]|uniref:hypothetical protein n=1 Tax=Streptomyces sp. NPDC057877 TaxID=3346269 RepID=UPI0036C5D449
MNVTGITRRTALTAAAGAGLVSTGLLGLSSPAVAAPQPPSPQPFPNEELKEALRRAKARDRRVLTGRPSANRWDMQKEVDAGGDIATCSVPGTGLTVAVRVGDVETVLVHVVRRFHYEVDALGRDGEPRPVEGWVAPSSVRDSRSPESNRASGTAVVIRPGSYPPGATGGFTAAQRLVIRDIIADTEGIVRWGGDDRHRPYEGLFYLTARPDSPRLAKVAERLRTWGTTSGLAAGTLVDTAQPSRRRRAARYQ